VPQQTPPPKPWRLSENDRIFLRKLRIDPSEDVEPDPCEACDGTGQTSEDLICPACRGVGYLKT
jgi:hypothetical protein